MTTNLPCWHAQSLLEIPPGHKGVSMHINVFCLLTHSTDFPGDCVISTTVDVEARAAEDPGSVALIGFACHGTKKKKECDSILYSHTMQMQAMHPKLSYFAGITFVHSQKHTQIISYMSEPYMLRYLQYFSHDPGLQPVRWHPHHIPLPLHVCNHIAVLSLATLHCRLKLLQAVLILLELLLQLLLCNACISSQCGQN